MPRPNNWFAPYRTSLRRVTVTSGWLGVDNLRKRNMVQAEAAKGGRSILDS